MIPNFHMSALTSAHNRNFKTIQLSFMMFLGDGQWEVKKIQNAHTVRLQKMFSIICQVTELK